MHGNFEPFGSRLSPAAFGVMGYYGPAFARLSSTADRIAVLQERLDVVQQQVRTRIAATDTFLNEQAVRLGEDIGADVASRSGEPGDQILVDMPEQAQQ